MIRKITVKLVGVNILTIFGTVLLVGLDIITQNAFITKINILLIFLLIKYTLS